MWQIVIHQKNSDQFNSHLHNKITLVLLQTQGLKGKRKKN